MTITTPSGHEFVLYENEAVTIDLFSSLFTTDGELKGSYSYAGKAPLLPNKKAIDYGDLLEKHTSGLIKNLQVRLGNIYWTNVNMLYEVNDGNEIEFSLTLNLSLINERLKNTSLTQIPFPVHHLGNFELAIEASMRNASLNTDWKVVPYTFAPVKAPKFTGGIKDVESESGVLEISNYVNDMRLQNSEMVFNAPNRLVDTTKYKYVVIPYYYLNFILSEIIDWLGFQKGGEVFNDPETSRMVIYNINQAYSPASGLEDGMYITASDHLPDISVAEFLKNLSEFGIYPLLKASTNELHFKFKRDIIERPNVKDWSEKVTNIENVEPEPYGGYSLKFNDSMEYYTDNILADPRLLVQNILTGNGENKHKLKVSTLSTVYDSNVLAGWGWQVPIDIGDGNILDPNFTNLNNFTTIKDKKGFPLKLLYYNGWKSWSFYPPYPQLSPVSAYTGKDLYLEGMYDEYLKDFMLATEGAKEVRIDFLLNHNDIANWKDDDIIVVKSKSGVNISCVMKRLSFDVKSNSMFVRAKGEGIILHSSFYKELPNDKFFIKYKITNIDSTNPQRILCDLVFTLYHDRSCVIPYTGNEIIPVDFVIKSLIGNITDANKSEIKETGVRIVIKNGSATYHTVFNASYEDPTLGFVLERRSFQIQENSRFYIV